MESSFVQLRWEFIKENKKVKKKENTLSTKRANKTKKRKNDNDQEKKERKHALDQEIKIQSKKKR